MCGIIGWSGSNPKRFNKQKFDILGLFNNSRGGDSCGVSTDGEIYYGTILNKNYDDFVINAGYLLPREIPAVIGHMRKASVGSISESNAHPFGFGEINNGIQPKFEFIGCHNGTLGNYEDLAKKYEVETSVWGEDLRFVRNKVDSEVLLEIIYKHRDIKVLEEYLGGAALLYQNLNDPNVLYAFHGASKKEQGDKDEQLYEERPLFYYQESKDSVYISSMEEALLFIGGEKGETVFQFDHNIVYRIENGNVLKATRFKVNRKEAGHRKSYASGFTMGGKGTATTIKDYTRSHRNRGKKDKDRSKTRRLKKLENVSNIYDETVMEGDFLSAIYYNKLRYWRNGHLINGVYTYIKDYGFFKVGDVAGDVQNKLYKFMGEYFSLEEGVFVPERLVDERISTETLFIPFEYAMKEPPQFFFYEGIMLETIHDFVAVCGIKQFTFEQLSQMSRYPICRVGKHRFPDGKQGIVYNAQPYTSSFKPLQSNNIYNIERGNLINIDRYEEEVIKEAEQCCSLIGVPDGRDVIQMPLKFEVPAVVTHPNMFEKDPMMAAMVKHESGAKDFVFDKPTKEFLDEDPPIDTFVSQAENDKVIDILNKQIMPIYEQMQVCNENLRNEESNMVQEIVELQKDFMLSIDCIIESKE